MFRNLKSLPSHAFVRKQSVRGLSSFINAKCSLNVHIHRSYDCPGAAADILQILKLNHLNMTHLDGSLHSYTFEGLSIFFFIYFSHNFQNIT